MAAITMSWKRRIIEGRSGRQVDGVDWWSRRGSGAGGALLGGLDGPRAVRAARGPDAVDRDRIEELADDASRLDVVDGRAGLDDQPMGEGRFGEGLDVVWDHVVATHQPGEGLAGPVKGDRAARRRAEVDIWMRPGGADETDDVLRDRWVDVDV